MPIVNASTTPTSLSAAAALAAVDHAAVEQVFDEAPDVVFFIKDAHARYIVVNQTLVERNGLRSKSQILGRRACDVNPGELGQIPTAQDLRVLATGRPINDLLELHWYAPQRPGWCLTTKLPLRDEAGAVVGIIGISRDVRAPVDPHEIPLGVAKAIRHLEAKYDEPVSPSSLARIAQLPAPRFARLIRRIYGLTPSQLITKTRLAAASRLLRETDLAVAEVALESGFTDHSAFSRAFRAAIGVTPTEFRTGNIA
jgi:AraC-like DNA-binding protein